MLAAVPAREGSHRASASRSSRRRSARAAASSSSAPARAAGSACSSRRRCRRPSAPAPIWCRRSWPAARTRSCARSEGVEDNYEEGARADQRGCGRRKKDVVIGVSASGMTPFVRGALTRARRAGSKIIFVTCDPRTELQTFVDLTIAPAVGPEVIAGSTRLKAGTATKIVLNMLTTGAMIRIGQDLRQPDGRRADGIREAARPRAPHHHDRHRPRVRRGRQAAPAGPLEREGGDRHAEERPAPTRRRWRGCAARTTSSATPSARTSKPRLRELLHLSRSA